MGYPLHSILDVSGGLFAAIVLLIIYYIFHRFVPWKTVKAPIEFVILAAVLSQLFYMIYEVGGQWSNSFLLASWGVLIQIGIGVLLFPIVMLLKRKDLKKWWLWCDEEP